MWGEVNPFQAGDHQGEPEDHRLRHGRAARQMAGVKQTLAFLVSC